MHHLDGSANRKPTSTVRLYLQHQHQHQHQHQLGRYKKPEKPAHIRKILQLKTSLTPN